MELTCDECKAALWMRLNAMSEMPIHWQNPCTSIDGTETQDEIVHLCHLLAFSDMILNERKPKIGGLPQNFWNNLS
jgi:hypothetical protein